MAIIKSNANHHNLLESKSVWDTSDERIAEYRRRWKDDPENFTHGDFPLHLDIESTNRCNLKCTFCGNTYTKYDDYGFFDFDLYKKVVDEGAASGLFSIKLNCRGEPLMHKRIADLVAYAKQAGIIDVFFNTNATLLTEEKGEALIDAGLDRLSISFEGHKKEVYENIRVGANFERTLENIRRFRELRDKKGLSRPGIRVQTVMLPELMKHTEEYVAMFKDIADEISYLDLREETERKLNPEMADWACTMLWQRMTIHWDGTLVPCIHDVLARCSFGNVKDISVKDAWLGSREKELRAAHRAGTTHELSLCNDCPHRNEELAKLKEKKL